jgi:hypothetical protein
MTDLIKEFLEILEQIKAGNLANGERFIYLLSHGSDIPDSDFRVLEKDDPSIYDEIGKALRDVMLNQQVSSNEQL